MMSKYPDMREARAPAKRSVIEDFETAHGIVLPKNYKQFLLETNGGAPFKDAYPIENYPYGDVGIVQSFKGIGVDFSTEELAYAYDWYRGGIPDKLLPIAGDGGGSFICLDLRNGTDRIAFWDHRHFWSTGEWRERDLYHIAHSFEDFLDLLRTSPY